MKITWTEKMLNFFSEWQHVKVEHPGTDTAKFTHFAWAQNIHNILNA